MPPTVTFTPSSINCGIVQPGSTALGLTQCAPLTAPVNVTAKISADTSGGALTLVSVTSWVLEVQIQSPDPGLPAGTNPKPVPVKVPVQKGQSNGITPLPVAVGQYVEVTVQFAPKASTPVDCTAALQISGDTWNPVSIPITAAVADITASVPTITVLQGQSATAEVTVMLVAGNATTANLYLAPDASSQAPNVTASLSRSSLPLAGGQPAYATLSVSASSNLSIGSYTWILGAWAYNNAYGFSVPVTINVGSPYFYIKSKLDGNVIDVVGASTTAGAGLDAYPQKTTGTDNQLWEFVADPAGSGYYFIKSKLNGNVIDIEGASTNAGALLDAYPQKTSGTDNQLWEFVADPAGSGYFFIVSRLNGNVIDVQGASTKAGALLDAYPWKFSGYDNQLWTVVNGSFPAVVKTVPEPSAGYSGSANYILANGSSCATLTGVKATIYFTEDLVWESSNPSKYPGFSIQLNAETNNNQPLDWQQFTVHMGDDQGLWPWINLWNPSAISSGIPLWDQSVSKPVASMPQAARIPAGYSIIIALQNDSQSRITGATWTVLDSSGNSVGKPVTYELSNTAGGGVPPADLSPIASLQVTFGGALDGAHATFSSGAGVIVVQADQTMTVCDLNHPLAGV